jgi:hypothetical protein
MRTGKSSDVGLDLTLLTTVQVSDTHNLKPLNTEHPPTGAPSIHRAPNLDHTHRSTIPTIALRNRGTRPNKLSRNVRLSQPVAANSRKRSLNGKRKLAQPLGNLRSKRPTTRLPIGINRSSGRRI